MTDSPHSEPVLCPDNEISGRRLRFVLTAELMKRDRQAMTVAEMVTFVARCGYVLPGRASKVISDALRTETKRGRVRRISRGVYAYFAAPRTTARRIRLFGARCAEYAAKHLTPTTTTGRAEPVHDLDQTPPWYSLNWLWAL